MMYKELNQNAETTRKNKSDGTPFEIRIVLVEGEHLYRKALKRVLEDVPDFSVLGDTASVFDARLMIEMTKPDIVVADIFSTNNDKKNDTNSYRDLISDYPTTHVLVLTKHSEAYQLRAAVSIGATGYLLKSVEIEELIQGVREVAAGRPFFCKAIAPAMMQTLSSPEKTIHMTLKDSDSAKLTSRELEVLHLLASGLTRKEIADRLFISVKTVSSHRENILNKLDLKSNSDLVRYALMNGISRSRLSSL